MTRAPGTPYSSPFPCSLIHAAIDFLGTAHDEVIRMALEKGIWCITGARYYASARSQICFSDPKFRYRPRPRENCLLRMRWASSIPANVMAALVKDLKPPIEAHRRLTAR